MTSDNHRGSTRTLAVLTVFAMGSAAFVAAASDGSGLSPAIAVPMYRTVLNVRDAFNRTVQSGFGVAHIGGSYQVASRSARFLVTPGEARIASIAAGSGMRVTLPSLSEANERMQATFTLPTLPRRGGGEYVGFEMRRQSDGSAYRFRVHVWPSGRLTLGFGRVVHGAVSPLTSGVQIPARLTAGRRLIVAGQVLGASPVTLQMRAWLAGAAEPAWQASYADRSRAQLTGHGAAGLWSYTSARTRSVTLTVRRLQGWRLVPIDRRPTSSPTPSTGSPTSTSKAPPPPAGPPNAGSAAPGDTNYPVPAGALFVSPSGSNTGNGSIGHPYATVAKAISAAASGATIVLRGGSYHANVTIPSNKVLTIQSYPGEAAWFDGSVPVTSWTKRGSVWVHTGWTAQFDSTPGYTRSIAASSNWLNSNYPMAAHPDQTWIDGVALAQVGSLADVRPGSFFVDYSTNCLYVGTDPAGHAVRASDLGGVSINVQSPDTVLRGFGLRRYATSVPSMGTVMLSGAGDRIENLVVSDNASQGIDARVSGITMNHVTAQNNGLLGIAGFHADGLTITNTLAQGNNAEHFNDSPVSGGIKITRTRGIVVRRTTVRNNQGNGLWLDESCLNFVVAGGSYDDNTHYGLIGEISSTGIITDNLIRGNGYDGVRITDTDKVEIWNNTFSNNYRSIELYQDSRTYKQGATGVDPRYYPDPAMTWVTKNIQIENNLMGELDQFHIYVYDSTDSLSANQRNITVDGDLFSTPGAGQAEIGWYVTGSQVLTFKSVRAFESYSGEGAHNTELPESQGPWSNQLVQATGEPLPLPGDIASAAQQPTDTRYIGAFWTSAA